MTAGESLAVGRRTRDLNSTDVVDRKIASMVAISSVTVNIEVSVLTGMHDSRAVIPHMLFPSYNADCLAFDHVANTQLLRMRFLTYHDSTQAESLLDLVDGIR